MQVEVKNLDNKKVGDVKLAQSVFGLPQRADILARMVHWQLAKRRAGTHKTRTISEIRGTTAKPFRQKGMGRARQGSLRSPQFRGGAVIFGPRPRDHGHHLTKKFRSLALRTALSTKHANGQICILDDAVLAESKTRLLSEKLTGLGIRSALIVTGEVVDTSFARAAANIPHIDVLPQQGMNVYDMLRRDWLVLTRSALSYIEERLQ